MADCVSFCILIGKGSEWRKIALDTIQTSDVEPSREQS